MYHDPQKVNGRSIEDDDRNNEEETSNLSANSSETDKAEGNNVRDIWKIMAFEYSQDVIIAILL